MSYLWIGRSAQEATKKDGVLMIPYDMGVMNEYLPVCWFFCLDSSGSMTVMINSQSRWNIACTLFEKVITDLMTANRPNDTVTIVTFNDDPTVLCEDLYVSDEKLKDTIDQLKKTIPQGNTNIELVTSILHTLMIKNVHLKNKTHRAAELFFTDGEATVGVRDPHHLQEQKYQLYQSMDPPPFLWCGAISNQANWRVVRGLSQASPISLWAYIRDSEMENFGREVGGVFASVINFRTFKLFDKTIMLLPDADNLFYCVDKPDFGPMTEVQASSLITMFKVQQLIEDQNLGKIKMDLYALTECKTRVEARTKLDDQFVRESVKWSVLFETLKTSLLTDLKDMYSSTSFDLPRQVSATRATYSKSQIVAKTSDIYGTVLKTY